MMSSRPEVLFIVLADEVIGVDFERLRCQPQWTHQVRKPNVAPIYSRKSLLNLFKDRKEVVAGLTHMRLESNVFLIGGERLKSGSWANKTYVKEHPKCYGGFSRKAFKLIKNKNTFTLERDTSMDLHFGKCSPMVANTGSQVYVLGGPPHLRDDHITWGTFEVSHVYEKYWGILKDAPPFTPPSSSEPNGQILGHLVLGQKLLITADSGKVYFFGTITRGAWQELDEKALNSFQEAGLTLPTNGISVPFFPEFNNDFQLVLSREGFEDAYAMLIYAPTCSLIIYQSLRELFYGRYPITEIGDRVRFNGGRNFFLLLPNNQICALWAGFDHYKRLRLFITIFSLELHSNRMVGWSSSSLTLFQHQETTSSRAPETTFLKSQIKHTFDCIVNDGTSANHVFDAFFC